MILFWVYFKEISNLFMTKTERIIYDMKKLEDQNNSLFEKDWRNFYSQRFNLLNYSSLSDILIRKKQIETIDQLLYHVKDYDEKKWNDYKKYLLTN